MASRPWIDPQEVVIPKEFQDAFYKQPFLANLLVQRGIKELAAAKSFLSPDQYQSPPIDDFPDIGKAAERILRAVEKKERICIWGDFDVDGQTSTTLLVQALQELGANVIFYIPDRNLESHGVQLESLKNQIQRGIDLIISCDTGITAHQSVNYTNEQRIDFIITDHHELPEALPEAYAIVNPHLLPPGHPCSSLAGVGVAYKLVEKLYSTLGLDSNLTKFLDLVAIGLVADVAELTGETRYLVQVGLKVLRETSRIGLQTLFYYADLTAAGINEEHIGFIIAPRLNALGRLANATNSIEFLTTHDKARAKQLAMELEALNAQRQHMTDQVFHSAISQIEQDRSLSEGPVLVLSHPTWPAGIIGIVASRLVEFYGKPVILIASPLGEPARGSARSVKNIHITQAISKSQDLLLIFGGHSMAAGFSLLPENIAQFRRRINGFVANQIPDSNRLEPLQIAAILPLSDLSFDFAAIVEKFAPFGAGNPPFIFASKGLRITKKRLIGRKKEHLQIAVSDPQGNEKQVLFWNGAENELPEGVFDLAYTIRTTSYRGQKELQLEGIAFKQGEGSHLPEKRNIQWIDYRTALYPIQQLKTLVAQHKNLLIWAEADQLQIETKNRLQITPISNLVIWTCPPNRKVLADLIETASPEQVFLFSHNPSMDNLDNFIKRLVGLVKFSETKSDGITKIEELAAACCQTNTAVILGLKYLMQRGFLSYQIIDGERVVVKIEKKGLSQLTGQAYSLLQAQLGESAAFRKYYQTTSIDDLIR